MNFHMDQTQRQTWIDTWCTKHKQHREGRELDVTKSKSVSCRGQREGRTSLDFPVSLGEFWNPFYFSLDLSLSLFFFWILLFLFYFIILSPTPLAWCSSWLRTNACLEFFTPIFHCQPLADISARLTLTQSSLYPFAPTATILKGWSLKPGLVWIHEHKVLLSVLDTSSS